MLLSREEFKKQVFARDKNQCLFCTKKAVDAHHILERKLFPDGGYYLNNGASLCEIHHLDAEKTLLSVEEIREKAKITNACLPPGFLNTKIYDKWGNEIINGDLEPGPLFLDEGCQRMLLAGKKI